MSKRAMTKMRPGSMALGWLLSFSLAACGASGGTSPASEPGSPAAAAPVSAAPSVAARSAPPSSGQAASAAASAASAGSSAAVSTAVSDSFGKNVCTLLAVGTIDQTLDIKIADQGWDGHVCTWVSRQPAGGATIGWLEPGSPLLVLPPAGATLPVGETEVHGLGDLAVGRVQAGLPSPLPPSQAFLIVKLPQGGMTVHVSGPAVTLDEAVMLAHDVLGS